VKSIIGSLNTYCVGNYYEKTGSTITKYYYAGATRIGMRKYTIPQSMVVEYFLGDHLGSTSITTDNAGAKVSEMRYRPFGEVRHTWKDATLTQTTPAYALTKWTFTGQYTYADDPSTPGVEDFGLLYFNARWVDPALGRFAQADTVIPEAGDPQAWDRYSYAANNPLRFRDPSGHTVDEGDGTGCSTCRFPKYNWYTRKAQSYASKSGGFMSTYAVAAIGAQNPYLTRFYLPKGVGQYLPYTGLGIAKVTDKQMNSPYGAVVKDANGKFRGYGLGMEGQDQTDPNVAVEAMMKRMQIVMAACDEKCTSTDLFLVAALSENGPGFNLTNMDDIMHGNDYRPRPTGTSHSIDWTTFISSGEAQSVKDNQWLIGHFASNVIFLQDNGWDVPEMDWSYVYSLTVSAVQ
jgi:RHS repeat-associated protein